MYHIKQNNIGCRKEIQVYGCFFRSCGLIAEIKAGRYLSVKDLNDGWDYCKAMGWIDENDDIKKSDSIINYFYNKVFGLKGKFVEVGLFKNGFTEFYSWTKADSSLQKIDALIQKISCNGEYGTHFRVVSLRGQLIEDPHEPEINVRGIHYSILYHFEKE